MKITVLPLTTDRIAPLPDSLEEHVEDCPRCGDHHGLLTFRRFQRPPSGSLGTLLYWSTCPITGEPILAEVI